MSEDEKSRLRGEAYTIMASRYFDAFRNFGGLCLAKRSYNVGENFEDGRATAWETVQFIAYRRFQDGNKRLFDKLL